MDAVISPLLRARTWSTPRIELRQRCMLSADFGVLAREVIPVGSVLMALAHVFVERAGRHTIQVDARRHQAGTGEIDDYLNHSCDPNCALDFTRLELVSRRAIAPGEELSFNYLTSEWDMAAPFTCHCGACDRLGGAQGPHDSGDGGDGRDSHNIRLIRGFRHLSLAEQDLLAPFASPYLRLRLADQRSSERRRLAG